MRCLINPRPKQAVHEVSAATLMGIPRKEPDSTQHRKWQSKHERTDSQDHVAQHPQLSEMNEDPAHALLKVKSWGTLGTVAPPTDLNKMISFERKRHALIHRESFKRLDESERSRRESELSDYRDQADPEMNR